jgi:hypothetical protein
MTVTPVNETTLRTEGPHVPRKTQPKTITTKAGSLVTALLSLEPLAEHAVVRYLDPEVDDLSPEGISAIKSKINADITKATSRIKGIVEAEYQVESAVFNTTRNRWYAAAIVTRTK